MARLSTDAQPFVLHICGNPKAVALIRHQFLHIEAKAQNQEDPVRKKIHSNLLHSSTRTHSGYSCSRHDPYVREYL